MYEFNSSFGSDVKNDWSDVQKRVHHIQKKRANIERRDSHLKNLHEKVREEAFELEKEKKAIEEEIRILRALMEEVKNRYHVERPDPLHQGIHREVMDYVEHIEELMEIDIRRGEKRVGLLLRSVLDSLK